MLLGVRLKRPEEAAVLNVLHASGLDDGWLTDRPWRSRPGTAKHDRSTMNKSLGSFIRKHRVKTETNNGGIPLRKVCFPLLVSTQTEGEGLSAVDAEHFKLGALVEQVSMSPYTVSWL